MYERNQVWLKKMGWGTLFILVALIFFLIMTAGCKSHNRRLIKLVKVRQGQHYRLAEENSDGVWYYYYTNIGVFDFNLQNGATNLSLPPGYWVVGPRPRMSDIEEEDEGIAANNEEDPAEGNEASSESSAESSSDSGASSSSSSTSSDSSSSSSDSGSDGGGGGGDD